MPIVKTLNGERMQPQIFNQLLLELELPGRAFSLCRHLNKSKVVAVGLNEAHFEAEKPRVPGIGLADKLNMCL